MTGIPDEPQITMCEWNESINGIDSSLLTTCFLANCRSLQGWGRNENTGRVDDIRPHIPYRQTPSGKPPYLRRA